MDLSDVHAGIEQQSGGGGAEGVGALEPAIFLDCFGQPGDDAVHAGLAHGLVVKLGACTAPRPENLARLQAGLGEVFGQRLGGGEMDADGAVLVAPFSLIVRVACSPS